jgi:hypothetical protein
MAALHIDCIAFVDVTFVDEKIVPKCEIGCKYSKLS